MLSRRNVRIKVMQSLYQVEIKQVTKTVDAVHILRQMLQKSTDLFNYLVYVLVEIAHYAETDSVNRANKNIVTSADLLVNKKILKNTVIERICATKAYQDFIVGKVKPFDDTEKHVKRIYANLLKSQAYQFYIEDNGTNQNADKEILSYIFKELMDADDEFDLHLSEHFSNWDDEYDGMLLLMMHYFNKPQAFDLSDLLGEVKWKYALDLIESIMTKKEILNEEIINRLRNWEPDRIARLDMIILQMGVSEFLYFETIPPKVTINEYIDLAKAYSTVHSGHFVNGVLDNIHKDFIRQNKMHKIDLPSKNSPNITN